MGMPVPTNSHSRELERIHLALRGSQESRVQVERTYQRLTGTASERPLSPSKENQPKPCDMVLGCEKLGWTEMGEWSVRAPE